MASKQQYRVTFNYNGHYQPTTCRRPKCISPQGEMPLDKVFGVVFWDLWNGTVSYVGDYPNIVALVKHWFWDNEENAHEFLNEDLEIFN